MTIAIVDTGVDFGTFTLSFPDYIARDSGGAQASFDADALGLVITNTTVAAYEGSDGRVYITTEGGANPSGATCPMGPKLGVCPLRNLS